MHFAALVDIKKARDCRGFTWLLPSLLNKKLLAKIFRIYQMVGSLEIFILTA